MEAHVEHKSFRDAIAARSALDKHLQYARKNLASSSSVRLVRIPKGTLLANGILMNGSLSLCLVCEGVVGVASVFQDGRRQILNFCFPGDVLIPDFMPNLPEVSTFAVSDALVLNATRKTLNVMAAKSNRFRMAFLQMMGLLSERMALRNMVLGRLKQNERLATFLLEAGLWSGRSTSPSTFLLELPMTREDIGDYLGLNAASVTRGLKAMERNGIIQVVSPRLIKIMDLEMVAKMSPVTDTLIDTYIALANVYGREQEDGPSQCLMSEDAEQTALTH
jgi:CRP-like cAMP-binding protein